MKTNIKTRYWVALTAIGLVAAGSANAAIQVTFDAAASNIGAGQYDFTITGITAVPTYDSTFELLYFSTIGNKQSPLGEVSAPTGWDAGPATIDLAEWYFQSTAGNYNGNFDITATPNLKGNITWDLAISGGASASGTVYIGAVPESSVTGVCTGAAALLPIGFVFLKRKWAGQA